MDQHPYFAVSGNQQDRISLLSRAIIRTIHKQDYTINSRTNQHSKCR